MTAGGPGTVKLGGMDIPLKALVNLPFNSVFEITRDGHLRFQTLGADLKRLSARLGIALQEGAD